MNDNFLSDIPRRALHINHQKYSVFLQKLEKRGRFIIMEICQSASAFLLQDIHAIFVLQCTQVTAKCSWLLEIHVKLAISAPTPPSVLFRLSLAPGSLLAPLTH